MDFDFFMPSHILSGTACVRKNSAVFASLGKRCLIVTGAHSAKACGALDDCIAALEEQGIAYELFDRIGQNPLISVCEAAGSAARAFGAEFLIGIGGGSPLDATKAIAFFACDENLHGVDLYGELSRALPMALIGTTAGTGSEVTPYAVLTIDETGRKKSFSHKEHGLSYATYVFSDPAYTNSLPYDFTVSTALDALCHALESYFATNATTLSDLFAYRGISLVVQALEELRRSPDQPVTAQNRERLLYGSLYAGVAINATGTGFCHPLGYFLTEEYQVPHGQACAVYLPAFLAEAKTHCYQKYAELWASLGYGGTNVAQLVQALCTVQLPALTGDQLLEIATRCAPTGNFLHSPGVYTAEKAFALLQKIYLRK